MAAPAAAHADETRAEFALPVPLYLVSFYVVGLSMSMLGPALTELRERSGADIGGIGVLFAGLSAGYIVGSLVAGRLFDRYVGHRVFAGSFVVMAAGLVVVPFLSDLGWLLAVFVVIGAGGASVDLGGNIMLMWHLGHRVARAMNTLHLSFGIGALSAPLLVHIGLDLAVLVAAAICVVLAAWALVLPSPVPPPAPASGGGEVGAAVLFVVSSFFFWYVGLETGFAGWVFTYGEELDFDSLAATWLVTAFWIAFTLGRVAASALGNRTRPRAVLIGADALVIVAAVILLIGSGGSGAVWAGTILIGFAMAPLFPTMLTYVERRIRVSGSATSWFIGASGAGGLVFPWAIGVWFGASGEWVFPVAMLALGLATTASFAASARILDR